MASPDTGPRRSHLVHSPLYFPGFRFDVRSGRLFESSGDTTLRPKVAAVLHYLLTHPGEIATKDELMEAVWPDGFVSDAVLTVCINELRRLLHDDPHRPRFIATIHRRGYRFVSPVSASPQTTDINPDPFFVDRERELATLEQWWRSARAGERQICFIAADAGFGKTTLVQTFVNTIRRREPVMVGQGQGIAQLNGGEPSLPFLDALADLCRGPYGQRVRDVLHGYAPSWLLQMPGLLDDEDLRALGARTATASTDRMLREIADALDVLSSVRPVVLVCEDLHEGDRASTELLHYVARRHTAASLLVLCTYRPAESMARTHPLRGVVQTLRGLRRCRHLDLGPLGPAAVEAYLARRLAPARPAPELVRDLSRRTEGNALFMVSVVDHLMAHQRLQESNGEVRCVEELWRHGIPESVRQLISRQLEMLEVNDRRLLEVAAVAGTEFLITAVAAGVPPDQAPVRVAEIEERLGLLVRDTALLRELEPLEGPDGTTTARFRFAHVMHQEVLLDELRPGTRSALLRRIRDRMQADHSRRSGEVTADETDGSSDIDLLAGAAYDMA